MNIKIVVIIIFLVFGAVVVLANEFFFDFGTSFVLSNEFLFGSMTDDKPNIIVIMTDDLDVNTLDTMLSKNWMPNLQTYVIDRGTEFTNSFVSVSKCCPSRATFLTGQYAHNHGVLTNSDIQNLNENQTLATLLQNNGYHTGHVGKYLNHYGIIIPPKYIPPGWDSWQTLVDPSTYRVYNYRINDNGSIVVYGDSFSDYQTDVLGRLASDFITSSVELEDSKPFFLLINTLAPHAENGFPQKCEIHNSAIEIIRGPYRYIGTAQNIPLITTPSFNETDVGDKPSWIQNFPLLSEENLDCIEMIYQSRLESLRAVDDLIGNLINSLENTGKLEQTAIIFTSDNGFLLGEHREWGKSNPYEESIRVPLYVSIQNNREQKSLPQLVVNTDLAPTILDLVGITTDMPMDGRSIVPLLSNNFENKWRNQFLVEHWTGKNIIFQYITTFAAIRTESQLYVEYQDGTREFYDLKSDPYQLDNQYDCKDLKCKKQIEILQDLLSDLKNCDNGKCQVVENR